jgi:hypothetical protein
MVALEEPFAGLGTRLELVSTDRYFRDVSIALHAREEAEGWRFLVRGFSRYEGIQGRVGYIVNAMGSLGGMAVAGDIVRFPCGGQHLVAVRRLFLGACKENPDAPVAMAPLTMCDKKSELTVTAQGLGEGRYELSADGDAGGRLTALRNALVKLTDARADDGVGERFNFACGHDHHALTGLLLQSTPNVRAVMREFEMNAAKGVLLAPGSQK